MAQGAIQAFGFCILKRSGSALPSRFLRERVVQAATVGLQRCVGKMTMDECIGPWSSMRIFSEILFEYAVSVRVPDRITIMRWG
jgi:hypothetical protein